MTRVFLLTDYRGQFYSSVRSSTIGFDLEKVKENFEKFKVQVEICPFQSLDLTQDFKGTFILYQSSEDRGLLYKQYINDLLLFLKDKGAILIPEHRYFNCHHNKLAQELILLGESFTHFKTLESHLYGTLEDFKNAPYSGKYPVVIKSSSGCTSKGVTLARNKDEIIKKIKNISDSFNIFDYARFLAKRYLRKNYIRESLNREKFILQEFIPNLDGDFKVLAYGKKFYVLKRFNRKNDFRASGSGLFQFLESPPSEILNAAEELKDRLGVAYISIDFANSIENVYLIEFQLLMFGTLTLEKSNSYFTKVRDGEWELIKEKPDLEREFVNSVVDKFF